ncbi:MAG: PEP-CTERM sorting domain-containing protein [Marinobacter sp.]|uniref:PEP-CTERM sorting domain-containing protein n=1 Tax=Marinobacter sp. TaxID=50741 RepID=UPI0034A022C2
MKLFSRALLGVALVGAASSASAALLKFEAAYGLADATAAEAQFLGNSHNQTTETFNGFANTGQVGSSDQDSWIQAAPSFDTAVGTFSMQSPEASPDGNDVNPGDLMIEDATTGEFGRSDNYDSQWLDSNDADSVLWDILDGQYNAFGFYISDANDQGAALTLEFNDGTTETLDLTSPLRNGNIAYITLFSDVYFSNASLVFNNGVGDNDGWGIDNVTLAKVPEPGTLALFGLGMMGLVIARRRKA